jgi:hypothetical protein
MVVIPEGGSHVGRAVAQFNVLIQSSRTPRVGGPIVHDSIISTAPRTAIPISAAPVQQTRDRIWASRRRGWRELAHKTPECLGGQLCNCPLYSTACYQSAFVARQGQELQIVLPFGHGRDSIVFRMRLGCGLADS